MKSSSSNTKNAPKKTQNRTARKTLARVSARVKSPQKSGASKAQKTLIGAGPFQGLDSQSAALLPALICAIEQDLTLKGLDPSISRRTLPDGLAYGFSVSQRISIIIGVTKPEGGTHLRFWIKAVLGHALPGPTRVHLLETLLQMNVEATFPIFLGVTHKNHIQAQYTARVHDQLALASIGDTIDRVVGYTMSIREKLDEQIGFAPLSFRGEADPSEAASEHPEDERQESGAPGPNGWVH
jgi:hypothetical protein